jgi:hypothetical protein
MEKPVYSFMQNVFKLISMPEIHNFLTAFGGTLPHRVSGDSVGLFASFMEESIYSRTKTRFYIGQFRPKIGVDQKLLLKFFPYRNSTEICPKLWPSC